MQIPVLKRLPILAAALILFPAGGHSADGGGWEPLFNGRDLSGWTAVHDVTFEAGDGCLRLVKGMGWLRSERQFRDFVLEFEWRGLDGRYDSGVFFRAGAEGKPWPTDGWQVNLRHDMAGGLVKGYTAIAPAQTPSVAPNEWCRFRLEVKGTRAVLRVNDELAWDYDQLDADIGYLGIQAENHAFEFRNLRLRAW